MLGTTRTSGSSPGRGLWCSGARRTCCAATGTWPRTSSSPAHHRVRPKTSRRGPVDDYARRFLLRCRLDEQRRPWRRRERRDGVVPERPSFTLETGISDPLLRALAEVPAKQRAAVVLRYCADLPVAEVAAVLRCSEGTVRSQASRGLETLRGVLEQAAERSA